MHFREVLPNGVRIVTEEIPHASSVSLGIWVRAGSRNETEQNHGASHFLEHLLFKGTAKRTARQIAEELEAVGGILNAFTTKEYTCYYARVLPEHLGKAVDLLTDIFFHSLLREEDVEKEKRVILEEIKMYEDSPDEIVHDFFARAVWNGHPLGKAILGTSSSVQQLTCEEVRRYYEEHYVAPNIVVAVAGKVKHEELREKLHPIFSALPFKEPKNNYYPPTPHATVSLDARDTEQVQLCLGVPGLAQEDERIYALQVLVSILGGGLSSRLFQEIREESGLAYAVYAYHSAYLDSGLFAVYAGTSPANFPQVVRLILKELAKVREHGVTPEELNRAKEQLRGNLLLTMESVGNRMSRLGRTEICFNRIISVEEMVAKILAVRCEEVKELAELLFRAENFSLAAVGPLREEIKFKELLGDAGL